MYQNGPADKILSSTCHHRAVAIPNRQPGHVVHGCTHITTSVPQKFQFQQSVFLGSFKAIGADECMYATQIPHLGCPSLHDSEIPMHYWKKGFWQIILIARIYFSAQVVKKQKNLTLMLNTTIISKSSCGCLYVDLGLDKGNPDHQCFSQQGEHSTRETLRCSSLTLLWSPCVSCQNWVISLIFRESTSSQEIRPKKNKKHRGHFSRIFIRSCCFKSLSSFSNKVIIHDYYDYLNIS